MTSNNLPPGVTPGDIDRHFGEPDKVRVLGTVHVGTSAEIYEDATTEEKEEALMDAVADGNIEDLVEVEVHGVEHV